MFHRFAMDEGDPRPTNTGALSTGTSLWTSYKLEPKEDRKLGEIIKWFNHYLLVPKQIHHDKGLFWFKDDAKFVNKSLELTELMKRHNMVVVHFISEDPGEILFEDKHQVISLFRIRVKWEILVAGSDNCAN